MKLKKISLLLITTMLAIQAKADKKEIVQENYIFEVPELSSTGPAFVSWFFLRGGFYWGNRNVIDINSIDWPKWDIDAIPIGLVPGMNLPSNILIYDENKNLIEDLEFRQPFFPEDYEKKAKSKPGFYQVKSFLAQNHLQIKTELYPWPRKKKVLSCEVDTSNSDFKAQTNKRLKLCMDTLFAYMGEDNKDTRQFYVDINWASVKGRENITAVQELERGLRSAARKRKMVFMSQKTRGQKIIAEVGLTQVELLPKLGFHHIPVDMERAQVTPTTKIVWSPLFEQSFEDGAEIKMLAHYTDASAEREVVSPEIGNYQVNLQIIDQKDSPNKDIKIVQTRSIERRTGLLGALRPFQFLLSGAYNQLSSGRGESSNLLAAPGLDVRYLSPIWGLQPYFNFEKSILHAGSTLEITELRAGVSKLIGFIPGVYLSGGYHKYSLSGKNPGSTRLGGITAISTGVGARQNFETWLIREKFDLLFGNSMSYDMRLDVGKLFGKNTDERFYIGLFGGYANYNAEVVNKLSQVEVFSENRLQYGISLGWIGADSF